MAGGSAAPGAGGRGLRPDRRDLRPDAAALPSTRSRRRAGYWIATALHRAELVRSPTSSATWAARASRTRRGFGVDIVFPAAMAGIAAALVTGRRELVAAVAGAVIAVAVGPRPRAVCRHRRWWPARAARRPPRPTCVAYASAALGAESADMAEGLALGPLPHHESEGRAADGRPIRRRDGRSTR